MALFRFGLIEPGIGRQVFQQHVRTGHHGRAEHCDTHFLNDRRRTDFRGDATFTETSSRISRMATRAMVYSRAVGCWCLVSRVRG
jgi:hypothetical protein